MTLPLTDPLFIFTLLLLLILGVPLLLSRTRIPALVGLLLAGMIVGPHGLGLLLRDPSLVLLGTIGLLYLMFLAGVEMDLQELGRQRQRTLLFGLLTFAIPQGLGTLVGHFLLGFDWRASILLGSMFASHTLLAYPIVSRMGVVKDEAVVITIGGTIITDVLALLVLAVIARMAQGRVDLAFWFTLVLSLGLYSAFMAWGMPWLGKWFFRYVDSGSNAGYLFILTMLFVAGSLAALSGVEAVIGAFLAGLALNRLVPEQSLLMNRLTFVGHTLFIPFFLISVGMLVDLRTLVGEREGWLVALTMVVTVTLTKWLAAFVAQKLFRYTAAQRGLIFGLSVAQAAATLAAVLVGYELGIFNEAVLNGSILMILVSCLHGSWAAEGAARTLARQGPVSDLSAPEQPQRLLVPIAHPAHANALLDLALLLREPNALEPIRLLSVATSQGELLASEARLAPLLQRAIASAAPVRPVLRVDTSPASGILRALAEVRITHLLIGWRGQPSAHERLFGSILTQLLTHSQQMVWLCKVDLPPHTMRRLWLLLPPHAAHEPHFPALLRAVKQLARQLGVPIHLLSSLDEKGAVGQLAEQLPPFVTLQAQGYREWGQLLMELPPLNEDDMLLLVGARPQTASWRADLEPTLAQLIQRHPTLNVVIAYPALAPPVPALL